MYPLLSRLTVHFSNIIWESKDFTLYDYKYKLLLLVVNNSNYFVECNLPHLLFFFLPKLKQNSDSSVSYGLGGRWFFFFFS